jgi:PE family
MSFVTTEPEALASAAGDLQGIGDSVHAGSVAATAATTGVTPPAADVVSALTAAQFTAQARLYRAVSTQAAAEQDLTATTLGTSAGSYAAAEAANSSALG